MISSLVAAMPRVKYFIVLTMLFAVQCIEVRKQVTYSYNSFIIARNNASDVGYSKWSISGDLTVQYYDNRQIFKLDNLRTSVFNGLITMKEPDAKEPLADTKYLTEPFAVYYKSMDDIQITLDERQPIWVTNMKKAIASAFYVDITAGDGFEGVEQTIYGNCRVTYEVDPLTVAGAQIFNKRINRNNCTDVPESEYKNVDEVDLNTKHEIYQFEVSRYYLYHLKSGDLNFIRSSSNFTYQNTPAVRTTHRLEQEQTFTLTNSVNQFEILEIPELATYMESVIWNPEIEKKVSNKTQKEIFNEYKEAIEEFKKKFKKRPLENTDISDENWLENIYKALSKIKMEGLALITINLVFDSDPDELHILLSILPYVGIEETTTLIKEFVKDDDVNDLLLIKLLNTFPKYVANPSQEILKKFKFLLNLKNVVNNTQVRHAGILSYASLISETCQRGELNEEYMLNIIELYQTKVTDSTKYEDRLTYLLGLINLGDCIKEDLILTIITDISLDNSLRTLATFGFKYYLANATEGNIFKKIWPIVKDASANFELRVASLDLLLSSKLTEEQFNTILNKYDKEPTNPYDEHLTNYVFTTLQSLENSARASDYIAHLAKTRLQTGSIPRYTRSWITGNYRLGFTDDETHYGISIDTSLIGTPVSNELNVIYLSYNHVEMSLALDSYTLYLRLGGVIDTIFSDIFLKSRTDAETPVSALVDMIKKFDYQIKKGKDIFVDIALFSKRRALFGIYINQDNIDTYSDNPLFVDLMQLLIYYQSVSYPLNTNKRIPSDLGTAIEISEDIMQVTYQEVDNFEQIVDDDIEVKEIVYHYKSFYIALSSIQSQNPLTNISSLVWKSHTEEKSIDFPFKFNSTNYSLSWKSQNDTFNYVSDRNIATGFDKDDILKHYCPDCNEIYSVPIGSSSEKSICIHELGFKLVGKKTNSSEEEMNILRSNAPTHHSSAFAFPPARPVLFLWNLFYYMDYINELDSCSIRTGPAYDEEYESVLDFNIDGDSITKDNDPLDNTELEVNVSFKNQKPNGQILSGFNSAFKLTSTAESLDNKTKSHVEHNYALYVDILNDDGNFTKLCINREILYPNRRSDKLSLKPVKPAKGKLTIAWGQVESFSECPQQYVKLTELYTVTEVQNRKAEELSEYKKCKNDSLGFKYIPPTPDCITAHNALSRYDFYGLYADFEHAGKFKSMEKDFEPSKNGFKVFEYNQLGEGLVNISIPDDFRAKYLALPDTHYVENSAFFEFSADPTAVAYDDYDIYAGISSTCVISPNSVETFTGVREPVFQENKQEEIIAYVECINETRAGLTVHRINNNTVGFEVWSGNNLLVATIESEKLKVSLNGDQINQTPETQDEDFKIYFLENDVIYIIDNIVEVYYTTEYISIKAVAVYNNYICGICNK